MCSSRGLVFGFPHSLAVGHERRFNGGYVGVDAGQVTAGRSDAEQPKPVREIPPAAGAGSLVSHCFQPSGNLAHDVCEPLPVLLRPFQPAERFGPAGPEAGDARRLLKDHAPVAARRYQQRVDAALLDHAIGLGRGAGAREEFSDVLQAGCLTVDEIITLAAAVDAAHDLHIVHRERQGAAAVVKNERHLGHVERTPAR